MFVASAHAQSWTQIAPTLVPRARSGAVLVYDPVRKEMVLFGGAATDESDETWILDDDVWTQRSPTHAPQARSNAYGFWDSKRERVVVFGGNAAGQIDRSVIWTWDGTDWSSFMPAANPPARRDAAVAYDSKRDRVVLFGGSVDGSPDTTLADTWEFDGSTWVETTPEASPGDRGGALMGYDPAREIVVLVNGYSEAESSLRRDTWIYDGSAWTAVPSANTPQGSSLEMIWDATQQKLTIAGRKETGSLTSWTFDGSAWTEHAASTYSLNGIPEASLAFDSERGVALYLRQEGQGYFGYRLRSTSWSQLLPVPQPGGVDVNRAALVFDSEAGEARLFADALGDFQGWRWDGIMWRHMDIADSPSPSVTSLVAYDAERPGVVAYDGRIFELQGQSWTPRSSATAPASSGAMAYDQGRGSLVYFGGSVGFNEYTDATWTWDGVNWQQLALPNSPLARRQAALTYDEGRQRMVLFGGRGIVAGRTSHLFDTWELSGSAWTQSSAEGPTELRAEPSMTYDQGRQRVVLWAAQREDESQLWEYDGTTWIGTEPPPIAGMTGVLGYDAAGQRLLLHDGEGRTWARLSGSPPDAPGAGPDAGVAAGPGGPNGNDGDDGTGDGMSEQDGGTGSRNGGSDSGCAAAPSTSSAAGSWLWIAALGGLLRLSRRRPRRLKEASADAG
jgi:hypothetical protein